jgi:hypothetical protein
MDERRKKLSNFARRKLIEKYGEDFLLENVQLCVRNPYHIAIRSWFQLVFNQLMIAKEAGDKWSGKKVAFVIHEDTINEKVRTILLEAYTMKKLGSDVQIITLSKNKKEMEHYCEAMGFVLSITALGQDDLSILNWNLNSKEEDALNSKEEEDADSIK